MIRAQFECPRFDQVAQRDFEVRSCLSLCVGLDRFNQTTSGLVFVHTECITENCCVIEYSYCFNVQTGQVEIQETATVTGNPPCQSPRPVCNLPVNHDLIAQSECVFICGE